MGDDSFPAGIFLAIFAVGILALAITIGFQTGVDHGAAVACEEQGGRMVTVDDERICAVDIQILTPEDY